MQSHRVVTSVDKEDDRELLTPPIGWFEPISLWVSRTFCLLCIWKTKQLTETVFSVCQVCLLRHV